MAKGGVMDVVYPYKRTPDDFELRYSLRSLVNVPHDRVIVAGDAPDITSDAVTVFKVPRVGADRYMSSTANIFAADVSGDFIVMNDDFFVLEPWTFRHEHKCSLDEALADSATEGDYRSKIASTRALLKSHGISDPLFYGLHTPTIYNRDKLTEMLREFPMPRYRYLMRTLYHNLFPRPSIRRDDCKVKAWDGDWSDDVLSISDGVARSPEFREWIDRRFPVASKYEVVA